MEKFSLIYEGEEYQPIHIYCGYELNWIKCRQMIFKGDDLSLYVKIKRQTIAFKENEVLLFQPHHIKKCIMKIYYEKD